MCKQDYTKMMQVPNRSNTLKELDLAPKRKLGSTLGNIGNM